MLRRIVKKLARECGYTISRASSTHLPEYSATPFVPPLSEVLLRRRKLLHTYGIDLVIDVGANAGQFAREMRHTLEYSGRIVSFEPLQSAFQDLQNNALDDANWEVVNLGLGERNEQRVLNIAGNSYSSSLLPMLDAHANAAPESMYIGSEVIEIATLDTVFDRMRGDARSIYLKIDTQGFEMPILLGAEKALPHINTIQLELSLTPLYKGQALYLDICRWLQERGYELVSVEPGFSDSESGRLLQIDGVFHRYVYSSVTPVSQNGSER